MIKRESYREIQEEFDEPDNDPYREFGEAWDRLWASIYDASRLPQVVEWMIKQLEKLNH